MIQKIKHGKILIGLKIVKIPKKTVPITNPEEFIQMVTLNHPKGTFLKAHMHLPKKRITLQLQECMVVKKGKIMLCLYSPEKKLIKKIYLQAGQAFILFRGGVAVKMIEDSEVYEIKNGPFKEDKILI